MELLLGSPVSVLTRGYVLVSQSLVKPSMFAVSCLTEAKAPLCGLE